jgi:3-mercaptopyruvate sulfurtransferase SseA
LQAWDGAIALGPVEALRADFVFPGRERPEMNLDYATFENWRRRPGVTLIDSRSEAEYSGAELKNGAFAAGHVPGAVHLCYSNCLDYAPAPFLKETVALEALYAPLASPEDTIIAYCHSGVRSAYVWFVLSEILHYPHVYNYDGSWTEWSYFQEMADNQLTN